jgi:acetyltransferase
MKEELISQLDPLFNPRSIAVIGATNNMIKWGGFTLSGIIMGGFKQKIYPISLKESKVQGLKAYKHVTEIPDEIDLAIFAIPAPSIASMMEECVDKRVKSSIIISAGLKEIGKEGEELEKKIIGIAKKGNMRVVGPNCMGIYSASSNLSATPAAIVKPGFVACVSQSGNVGGTMLMWALERGIGFSRYVSCGNCADLQIEDYIEYFGEDGETKIIMAYIEGLNDGRRFIDKVSRISKEKPVIALKCGKTKAGEKAAKSHSGSLSGTDRLYDVAFKRSGVLRVERLEELFDVTSAFIAQPLPHGKNMGIIADDGGGSIAVNSCKKHGLNVVEISNENERIEKMLISDKIDAILMMKIRFDTDLNEMAKLRDEFEKPIIIASLSTSTSLEEETGMYIYPTPERAVTVIAKLVEYSEYLKR